MILDSIVKKKREEIKEKKIATPLKVIKEKLHEVPPPRGFGARITRIPKESPINLIAEIKHTSPIKGILRKRFDPFSLAKEYATHKVSAISVLTDKPFFGGEISHLKRIKEAVDLPILRKDFIIDPYQIFESRLNGADAILLIASILSQSELCEFLELTQDLGMDAIVEIHTEKDLEKALEADPKIIGINNRNLYTFAVDLKTTLRLKPQIPPSKTVVSESGVKKRSDLLLLQDKGIDAVLVGEAILRSEDVGKKIDELLGLDDKSKNMRNN
jgi:indole-3-glycerol phosphate synthase